MVAGQVVHLLVGPLMAAAAELGAGLDWKTSLQELAAVRSLGVPEYLIDDERPRPREDVRGAGPWSGPPSSAKG